MEKKVTKKSNVGKVLGVATAISAIGAAAYLMFGPDAKKNKKIVRSWAVKMKGEIIEKFEKAKEITEPVYNDIVEKAQARYSKLKNVDQAELELLVKDIKKHWKVIAKDAKPKKK